MNIISGIARNIILKVPDGLIVRPTSGRSRKALFDSLGLDNIVNSVVVDLFAGSGALALEAASRGAYSAVMIELDRKNIKVIEDNISRVIKAGVDANLKVINANAANFSSYSFNLPNDVTLIFADPPYDKSLDYFKKIISDKSFCDKFSGATLVWEIPDLVGIQGEFINKSAFEFSSLRKFGGTTFLIGQLL